MHGLKKLLNLIRHEQGRVFVIDESGEPQFVLLNIAEYESLQNRPSTAELAERLQLLTRQTEQLNQAITSAQMEDWSELEDEDDDDINQESSSGRQDSYYIEPIVEERV